MQELMSIFDSAKNGNIDMAPLQGDEKSPRFLNLFTPQAIEMASISPDGLTLVYSFRRNNEACLAVYSLADGKTRLITAGENTLTGESGKGDREGIRDYAGKRASGTPYKYICEIHWVTNTRFIMKIFQGYPISHDSVAVFVAVNTDGGNPRVLWQDAEYYGREMIKDSIYVEDYVRNDKIPGAWYIKKVERGTGEVAVSQGSQKPMRHISVQDPRSLLFVATKSIYSVDTETGRQKKVSGKAGLAAFESAKKAFAENQTARRKAFAVVKASMEALFKNSHIEIKNNDDKNNLHVVKVSKPTEPPAFYLYAKENARLIRLGEDAPLATRHISEHISYKDKDGCERAGVLTLPARTRVKRPPLVVVPPFHKDMRADMDYSPVVAAVADMGFAVLQLDGWGEAYAGKKAPEDRSEETLMLQHLYGMLDALAGHPKLDSRKVALLGEPYMRISLEIERNDMLAGMEKERHSDKILYRQMHDIIWHSMRSSRVSLTLAAAVQNDPRIKCSAIFMPNSGSIEVEYSFLMDMILRIEKDKKGDVGKQPAAEPDAKARSVLLRYYNLGPYYRATTNTYKLYADIAKDRGLEVDAGFFETGYVKAQPEAQAALYRELEGYLNNHLYNFDVKMGELRVVE